MDQYQKFIAARSYARWDEKEGRRETWDETVKRYTNFWVGREALTAHEGKKLFTAIRDLEVMPSMRCMMTAGAALERDNVAGFNCSYLPIDHPRAFDECMYILMCGTGVGYSVERQYIQQLPTIPALERSPDTCIVVPDSKIGWADSFRQLINHLYNGYIPRYDTSRVRPAGARLRTFGGRASGPEPLEDLFDYAIRLFEGAAGRRLDPREASDLVCKVGEVVVVGGVRRSALICLSNPSDGRMRTAKTGAFWDTHPERYLANLSACYTDKPDFEFFLNEMKALYESKSGERGVFSREAAKKVAGRNGRRDTEWDFGTNPCSEIILRPNQFCNLSEVVVRPEDTLEKLKKKVEQAAILGTLQATLTDFRYLRPIWKKNTEEEALLGVSLTGIMDHPILNGGSGQNLDSDSCQVKVWLEEMRNVAIKTNKKWAKRLGINQATAVTCVKPSGTVSQLVDSASGIHPRYASKYVRTVRADVKDPLSMYMQDAGFEWEYKRTGQIDEWGDHLYDERTVIFSFAHEAPSKSVIQTDVGAMDQLKIWKIYQDHWCEHKPSITVHYTDDEFFDVCGWMWKNFDSMSGIALLPYDDHVYPQAPYQKVSDEEWARICGNTPEWDWEQMNEYEQGVDATSGSQELACVGTSCEL